MHKRNELATLDSEQMFWDILTIVLAFFVSFFLLRLFPSGSDALLVNSLWMPVIFGMVFTLMMLFLRMYNLTTFYYKDRLFYRSTLATVVGILAMCSVVLSLGLPLFYLLHSLIFGLSSLLFILVQRFLHAGLVRRVYPFGNAVFVGDKKTRERYHHFLGQTSMRLRIVQSLSYTDEPFSSAAAFEHFLTQSEGISEVVFAYGSAPSFDLRPFLAICEEFGVTIRLLLNVYEGEISQRYLSSMGTFPVITYHSVSFNRGQLFYKRIFDIAVSLLGLILCAPLLLVVAIIIRCDSPGKAVFCQPRAGRNGKIFTMYKFRSMQNNADEQKDALKGSNKVSDGMMFKMDNDPRITRVGEFLRRTSIDELPQLLNVLIGNMSLVGTRPPTLDEVAKYTPSHWRRISIKPGITGMWQISGRSEVVDFEKVVELDKKYIDNWSIGLDFKLLLKTVAVVLRFKGAQ